MKDSGTHVVDVAVRGLRGKVDQPFDQKLIHTIRGDRAVNLRLMTYGDRV